ncbi:MAG: WecB/TagA/CpsF family glycosyltransferase [Lentisphaeria bacterium]
MNAPGSWRDTVMILGIPVDRVGMAAATERIFALVAARRQAPEQPPALVATVNVDFLVNAQAWRSGAPPRHPALLAALRQAELVTADGMPVVWLSRLLGSPLPGRVPGADLVPALAAACAARGRSLYFLGGRGDTGRRAAERLRARHPALRIAGIDAPVIPADGSPEAIAREDAPVVDRINASGADILLVGLGNPKQELWFRRNRPKLRVPVVMGVGGTFAFITGDVARAPGWMQAAGLEWLFRIWAEPGRLWKRYGLGLLKFNLMAVPAVAAHFRALLAQRLAPRHPAALELAEFAVGARRIAWATLPEAFTDAGRAAAEAARRATAGTDALILDFGRTRLVDAASLAFLTDWVGDRAAQAAPPLLTGVSPGLDRQFQSNRAADLLAPFTTAGYPELVARLASQLGVAPDGLPNLKHSKPL